MIQCYCLHISSQLESLAKTPANIMLYEGIRLGNFFCNRPMFALEVVNISDKSDVFYKITVIQRALSLVERCV